MRQRLFQMMTSILLMSVLGGCGADDESAKTQCAKLACDAGATMCFGNIAATCNADGTQWNTEDCGVERGCVDVDGTFQCKSRDARCFGATDQAFCVEGNVRALVQCSANGTAAESITCDLSCAGGACREAPCDPGATVCGFRSIATCMENGVSWEHTACGESEVCVDGACVAETCAPLSRGCKDE